MKPTNSLTANRDNRYPFFLVGLFILSALVDLSYSPIYCGDDFYFHMRRFKALAAAIADGSFPFYTDYTAANGYGYLSNVFYPNILLTPFAALANLIGDIAAYRTMLMTMTILCGTLTYHAVRKIYGCHFIAFTASLLYTFSAYRLLDLYQRAALGEALSFTFLPIALLGLYYILYSPAFKQKWHVISIGFTLLIFSHLLASVLTFALVLLIVAASYKRILKEPLRLAYLIGAGVATIMLAAAFVVPLLEQMSSGTFLFDTNQWAVPHKAKLSFLSLLQGLLPLSGSPAPSVGILLVTGILLRIFIRSSWTNNRLLKYTDIGVVLGLSCILASSSIFPWARFPFNQLSYLQFPWRLFEFASLFFAVATAFYLSVIFKESKQRLLVRIVIMLLCTGIIIIHSSDYRLKNCNKKDYIENTTIYNYDLGGGCEYVPAKFGSPFRINERNDSIACNNANTRISGMERNGRSVSFTVAATTPDIVELPLFHYKGYAATINGVPADVSESENGLVDVAVSSSGNVNVWYEGTTTQWASWIVSAIAFVVFCVYLGLKRNRHICE